MDRWVAWRYESGGEKPPYDSRIWRPASVTDPAAWESFDEALAFSRRRGMAGVGFVFAEGDPYSGVDLDDCRVPLTGAIQGWAEEIVREQGSYTEVSPSGTGLKVF